MVHFTVGVLVTGLLLGQASKVDLPMPPPPPARTPRKAVAPPAPAPIKLAMPGLSAAGVDPSLAEFFAEYFAQKLGEQGVRVTTQKEISSLLGLERQRQMLGCSEQAQSCLAELAGALGVDGVVLGTVAKVGSGFAVTLKIISAQDGRVLVSASDRFKNDKRVVDWLGRVAPPFAAKLGLELRAVPASDKQLAIAREPQTVRDDEDEVRPAATPSAYAWIPFASAGVLAVAGGGSYGLAKMKESDLRQGIGATSYPELNSQLGTMNTMQTAAVGLGVAALVAGAVGGGLVLFGGSTPAASASLAPSDHGLALVLDGRLP